MVLCCRYPPKDTSVGVCPYCQKVFPQRVLATHMRRHNMKVRLFKDLYDFNLHVLDMLLILFCVLQPGGHICAYGCGFEANDRSRMNEHVRLNHTHMWHCHLCETSYSQKAHLDRHFEDVHDGQKTCEVRRTVTLRAVNRNLMLQSN